MKGTYLRGIDLDGELRTHYFREETTQFLKPIFDVFVKSTHTPRES